MKCLLPFLIPSLGFLPLTMTVRKVGWFFRTCSRGFFVGLQEGGLDDGARRQSLWRTIVCAVRYLQ